MFDLRGQLISSVFKFIDLINSCFLFSWGSGANPWGHDKEEQFASPNHYDGMLEVVGISGIVHLGQIQSGLRSGIRIAQVRIISERYPRIIAELRFPDICPEFTYSDRIFLMKKLIQNVAPTPS